MISPNPIQPAKQIKFSCLDELAGSDKQTSHPICGPSSSPTRTGRRCRRQEEARSFRLERIRRSSNTFSGGESLASPRLKKVGNSDYHHVGRCGGLDDDDKSHSNAGTDGITQKLEPTSSFCRRDGAPRDASARKNRNHQYSPPARLALVCS